MGVNRRSGPRRAYYPSGPWIDGIRPPESTPPTKETPKLPNPDPTNYKVVKAEEHEGWLVLMLNYPDCTNFEGNKILVFRGVTLSTRTTSRPLPVSPLPTRDGKWRWISFT